MKKTLATLTLLFLFVSLLVSFSETNTVLKLDGGPPYNTRAPGEKTCSGPEGTSPCHSGGGADNSGPAVVSILFGGGATTYVPGQTYLVQTSITRNTRNRFGFQIVSLRNSNNMNVGMVTLLDTAKTRSQQPTFGSFQDRVFVMHKLNGTFFPGTTYKGEWSYNWTAPSANMGPITFYACFVAANNDGKNDPADEVYYTSLTINPAVSGVEDPAGMEKAISVFPNPVSDIFFISYKLDKTSGVLFELFDTKGRIVQSMKKENVQPGLNIEEIELNEPVSAGIYVIRVKSDSGVHTEKIIVK